MFCISWVSVLGCRRQRVCQWRCQCRGAETSGDDTRDSRHVSVLSALTTQSVQAVHLVNRWLGVRILSSAPSLVLSRLMMDEVVSGGLKLPLSRLMVCDVSRHQALPNRRLWFRELSFWGVAGWSFSVLRWVGNRWVGSMVSSRRSSPVPRSS